MRTEMENVRVFYSISGAGFSYHYTACAVLTIYPSWWLSILRENAIRETVAFFPKGIPTPLHKL